MLAHKPRHWCSHRMDMTAFQELVGRQGHVFARRQVLALGGDEALIRKMLRRREWSVVFPGVMVDHTGEPSRLHALSRDVFKLHNVDGSMDHSTRFVLIDRHSRIRGYYATSEEGSVNQLVTDIRRLAREAS